MSFLGSFFGSTQRKDLAAAQGQANTAIDQGLQQGTASYRAGQARFDPYAQGGAQGWNALLNATGVNGADAQRGFIDNYVDDPTQALSQQAVARQMAARGLTDSGASRLAAARVWQEGYNNNLNRLTQIGQQGQQAAGSQAQFDQGIGDMEFGTGQLKANNAINYGNALAQSRGIGINNLLNVAGTAARFVNPYGAGGGGGGGGR